MWWLCMAGSVLEIISIVGIALLLNVVLFMFASAGFLNLSCPDMVTDYNETLNESFTVGGVVYTQDIGWNDIVDMAIGRCEGLPFLVVLLIEIPLLLGLLYVIRMFVGVT